MPPAATRPCRTGCGRVIDFRRAAGAGDTCVNCMAARRNGYHLSPAGPRGAALAAPRRRAWVEVYRRRAAGEEPLFRGLTGRDEPVRCIDCGSRTEDGSPLCGPCLESAARAAGQPPPPKEGADEVEEDL